MRSWAPVLASAAVGAIAVGGGVVAGSNGDGGPILDGGPAAGVVAVHPTTEAASSHARTEP